MDSFENLLNNEYIRFLIIIISDIIFITVAYFILKFFVRRIAGKRKKYENFILKQLSKPVLFLIFVLGLFTAVKSLSYLTKYELWIHGVFFVIVTLIVALIAARIITVLMTGWLKIRRGFERTPKLLSKVVNVIIFLIALVIILGYFKLDITPFVAGVGLGALAIGLALQSTLSNFFAGLHLVSDKPINVGDFIEDIGWRSTRLKTLQNNYVIIPNSKLAESTITNNSLPELDMKIFIESGVAYESDLEEVEQITLEVAKEIQETVKGAAKDFEPILRFRKFGDSNIEFITILKVEEPMDQFPVRHEFIKKLKNRFDKEKIEISWPIRKIYNIKK